MTARRIFAAPLAVGIISGVGLLAALLGDDLWDALSWATLGLPVVLIALFVARGAGGFSAARRRTPPTNLPRRGRP